MEYYEYDYAPTSYLGPWYIYPRIGQRWEAWVDGKVKKIQILSVKDQYLEVVITGFFGNSKKLYKSTEYDIKLIKFIK